MGDQVQEAARRKHQERGAREGSRDRVYKPAVDEAINQEIATAMWSDRDDEIEMPTTFPLTVAPAAYVAAVERCWLAIGYPDRKGCLIGVDGVDGAGKSSFTAWLAWQLGMPCLFLNDLRMRRTPPLNDVAKLVL